MQCPDLCVFPVNSWKPGHHMVSSPLWKLKLDGWGRGLHSTTVNLPPHDLRLIDPLGSVTLDPGKAVSGSLILD